VLNIRGHAEDPSAVMSQDAEGYPRLHFTAEDEQLLRDANPGFEPFRCPGFGFEYGPWLDDDSVFRCTCDE
jgi:hypothetical protein